MVEHEHVCTPFEAALCRDAAGSHVALLRVLLLILAR